MDEFDVIDQIVDTLGDVADGPGVTVGPGDDAAVLALPAGHELVTSVDTLVAGRHYPAEAQPDCVGYRSLSVATSDLAAMGAVAGWAVVALTSPRLPPAWTAAFANGVRQAALDLGVGIVGGNLARGPQSVTITVFGHLPAGTAILRSGAKLGDTLYVTGTLGGAGLALADGAALEALSLTALDADTPQHRYWKPPNRLALGSALRGIASAALDVSDGLVSDLDHLCVASRVCCEVRLDRLPVFAGGDPLAAAAAGDDYELVFAASPRHAAALQALAARAGVPITAIGAVAAAANERYGASWWLNGQAARPPRGYRHF